MSSTIPSTQINDRFSIISRFYNKPVGTTPSVGDVGDDVVGLFEHPVVAPGDGIVWVDRLDSLREHSSE